MTAFCYKLIFPLMAVQKLLKLVKTLLAEVYCHILMDDSV